MKRTTIVLLLCLTNTQAMPFMSYLKSLERFFNFYSNRLCQHGPHMPLKVAPNYWKRDVALGIKKIKHDVNQSSPHTGYQRSH